MSRRCATCIYRRNGRQLFGASAQHVIREARGTGGFVICHASLPATQQPATSIPPAICHGYAQQFPDTFALRIARTLGYIDPIDPPPAHPTDHPDPEGQL